MLFGEAAFEKKLTGCATLNAILKLEKNVRMKARRETEL